MRRLRVRLILLISVVSFADFVFGALYVGLLLEMGFSAASIGLLLMVSGTVNTLCEAPSGALGDWFGQRRILILGLVLWGASLAIFGSSPGSVLIVVAFVLWGIGMACYSGAPYALIVNELKREDAGDHMASVLSGAQVARWLASGAGALSVYFAGDLAARWVLVACGAVMLVSALLVRLTWPETSKSDQGLVHILRAGLLSFGHSLELQRVTWYSVVISMVFAVTVLAWQPLLLGQGWTIKSLGLALFLFTLVLALGSYLSRFTKKNPRPRVLFLAFCAALALALVGIGILPIVTLAVAQLFLGTALATIAVWSHSVFIDELRNVQGSILAVAGGLVAALVVWGFGYTWEIVGIYTAVLSWALGIAILCVMGEIFLRVVVRSQPEVGDSEPPDEICDD